MHITSVVATELIAMYILGLGFPKDNSQSPYNGGHRFSHFFYVRKKENLPTWLSAF